MRNLNSILLEGILLDDPILARSVYRGRPRQVHLYNWLRARRPLGSHRSSTGASRSAARRSSPRAQPCVSWVASRRTSMPRPLPASSTFA